MLPTEISDFHSKETLIIHIMFMFNLNILVVQLKICFMFSKIQNRNTVNQSTLRFISTKDKTKKTLLCSKIQETSLKGT